jgi:L-asparaginase / beta-aspartyl-peptidase
MGKIALAIHGGAGTILRSAMTPDLEKEYRHALEMSLKGGWRILDRGGSSLEAVEATVAVLEDFPLFNAGRGSVFTSEGKNEMDAAIMDGSTQKAGAVAFVRNVRNPIKLARLVMELTEHVLLAGEGANRFAIEAGVEFAPDEYFYTEHRWQQLQDAILTGRVILDHAATGSRVFSEIEETPLKPIGTVGAVACDKNGRLAAATSTGGMTNKKFGRIGDTPLIGAGTYADDNCAVSCTGHGEYFMLGVTAYDVAARMKYMGVNIADAAQASVDHLTSIGGEGGLIAVDRDGNVTLPFNSDGMYRGWAAGGKFDVSIYGD